MPDKPNPDDRAKSGNLTSAFRFSEAHLRLPALPDTADALARVKAVEDPPRASVPGKFRKSPAQENAARRDIEAD